MPADSVDHEAWEERLRAGDESALAELFTMHKQRLWQLVNFRLDARLRQRLDADDVLQETWAAAAARLQSFGEGGFKSSFLWLRLIALQTLTDLHRRHVGAQRRDAGREVGLHQAYPEATSASLAAVLAGSGTSPSRAAARGELVAAAGRAIGQLSPDDQEILALRHFEELTNGEAARVLNVTEKTASIRYIRALRRLREALAQAPGFFEDERRG